MSARAATVAALVVAALLPGQGASAAGPAPAGEVCGFVSMSDTTGQMQSGEIDGGPLVAPGSAVSITCSIHVDNGTHSGTAAVSASATGQSVVVLPPTPMSYPDPEAQPVHLCTEATVDGTAWYWDGAAWTTDPDAPCVPSIDLCEYDCVAGVLGLVYSAGAEVLPPEVREVAWDPVFRGVGCWITGWCHPLDALLCSSFEVLFPPEGDIPGIWDCPPYEG